MNTLIIGMGEVGKAHYKLLRDAYPTECKDIEDKKISSKIDIMHVCIRYSPDFINIVQFYISEYKPSYINICTTVPPGTTKVFGNNACHSTTRGLHPNLTSGLLNIKKHIGGPCSDLLKIYFENVGIKCVTHNMAITTELAHILNNTSYGINLMFADEMAKICRHYGVDYYEAVIKYTETNNEGFEKLDQKSKRRMILTPPNGHIGGHCVTQNAEMLSGELHTPLIGMLAQYNKK